MRGDVLPGYGADPAWRQERPPTHTLSHHHTHNSQLWMKRKKKEEEENERMGKEETENEPPMWIVEYLSPYSLFLYV